MSRDLGQDELYSVVNFIDVPWLWTTLSSNDAFNYAVWLRAARIPNRAVGRTATLGRCAELWPDQGCILAASRAPCKTRGYRQASLSALAGADRRDGCVRWAAPGLCGSTISVRIWLRLSGHMAR